MSYVSPLVVSYGAFVPEIQRPPTIPEIEYTKPDGLSHRQRQVCDLIVQGKSNKEIGRALGLAEGTVKVHVAGAFQKLGVRHRSAVAVAAGFVKN